MTYEQISALLSLLAAIVITAVNFYPWYSITYDGAPKVKRWGKIILFLCIALIISSTIFLFYPKNNSGSNKDTSDNKEIAQGASRDSKVELIYNNSTGELYPILPENSSVHSCVWTIWGDHGSQAVVITKSALLDKFSDPVIESNNFLPPRVPIYMTCVDWENNVYSGTIGEY
ncbi:MAG: hypothetical protein PHX76_03075 [Patescibacteria group bacterium]|nr:hypothetical protein [Patescibacteria group bacterium]MDD3940235.1 hypothetical protein [Candidatus Paceibacterota bacterium]